MTIQLIPVFNSNIQNEQVKLVDALLLHGFLEVGKRFASWITDRINEYQFIENTDFIVISQKREIGHGRGKKDYHITLDMAKELSMIERTEKGRQARKYFIECEKQLHNIIKKTTVDQRTPLRDAVNLLVSKKALTYSEAYSVVHQRFNVASIEDLPLEQLPQAIEYVHKIALQGEYIAHHKEQNIILTLKQFYDLAWVCNVARYMHKRIELITPALNIIDSGYHGTFREMAVDHS